MKKLFFLIFTFCLSQQVFAQEYPLEVYVDSFQIELRFEAGQFNVISTPLKTYPSKILKIENIEITDAALVVSYLPEGMKSDFAYLIELEIEDESGNRIRPTNYQKGGLVYDKGKLKKDIILQKVLWEDVLEGIIFPGKKYSLMVRKTLLGKVDCEAGRPKFSRRHLLEHSGATVVGAGLLGAAWYFHNQKNSNYERYENLWKEGASESLAQPFIDDAESAASRARWMSVVGGAILAADGIVYFFFRRKELKKRQGIYDRFCNKQEKNELSFLVPKPIYSPDSKGALGLKWSVSF